MAIHKSWHSLVHRLVATPECPVDDPPPRWGTQCSGRFHWSSPSRWPNRWAADSAWRSVLKSAILFEKSFVSGRWLHEDNYTIKRMDAPPRSEKYGAIEQFVVCRPQYKTMRSKCCSSGNNRCLFGNIFKRNVSHSIQIKLFVNDEIHIRRLHQH